jgi:predicted transcriptional regulator
MARPGSGNPTELELEILKVLWDDSPLPVREVRARLESRADRPLAHSSVITMLNIMHRKGFVRRKKEGKSFLFSPKLRKDTIARGIVGDVLSRVFEGSASDLVLNLLETADFDFDELDEIRKLIARKSKEQKS